MKRSLLLSVSLLALIALLLPVLSGCDLPGGGGGNATRLRLMLTDVPAPDVAEVHVRITSVEVLDNAGRSVALIRGADLPVDIDLPRLARRPLLLGEPEVPVGNYSTIRLTLSTLRGDNWIRLNSGARHDLTLPRGPTVTARLANGAITAEEGETTTVLLDFMAEASIRQASGAWAMRPVVFAAIAESQNPLPGSLSGRVLNRNGRPVDPPGNTVLDVFLLGALGPVALGEVSTRDGAFSIPSVLAGTHTLRLYFVDPDSNPVGDPLEFSVDGGTFRTSATVNITRGSTRHVDLEVR